MTREVEYVDEFSPEDRRRHRHVTRKGRILKFSVQYETKVSAKWYPVVRYDTAHGFVHRDVMHPNRHQEKVFIKAASLNEALTLAEQDIRQNWMKYKEQFLGEFEQ